MITVSNEIQKTLELVKKASDKLNDAGDVESTTLDNAASHLKCVIDMLEYYLKENE